MPPAPPSQQQSLDFQYLAVTGLVLVSWELLVHFFQDLSYLRTKGWYKRPVLWAYFLQRYGAFAVIVAQSNIRLGHPPSCYAAGMVSLIVGGVFVLPSISLIYLYRVLAIWNKKPFVKWTLIVLWVATLGASITAPFSQQAANLPNGTCTVIRSEKYTPASFIANSVYDGVVFLLTVVKLLANRKQYKNFHSPVQTMLLRDGILYFAVAVAIGITDIVFLEVAVESPSLASTVIPLHIALTSVMTTRLVNNVFQIVTDGGSNEPIRFISNKTDISSGDAADTAPSNGRTKASGISSTKDQSTGTVMMIGSGVGTQYYDQLDLPGRPQPFTLEKKSPSAYPANTSFSYPMQVHVTSIQDNDDSHPV